jgi:uncharacterized protein YjaZ
MTFKTKLIIYIAENRFMFRILFLVITNLIGVACFAQNIKARADSLYQAKNFAAAAPVYLWVASLAEFKGTKAGSYYDAACCFALSNQPDSAFKYLNSAKELGWSNKTHLLKDTDLSPLHGTKQWEEFTNSMSEQKNWTDDPLKANLVTSDITNFWNAYDLVQKDTANRLEIYMQYYTDKGSPGLQDYFASKVGNMRSFVRGHDAKKKFYAAIRNNTLQVEKLKPQMITSFVKFKELYPQARFSNVTFVIGNWTSGGTASNNGMLIGTDQMSKTDDVPIDELNLWERNNFQPLENLPHIIAHELIHFNQDNLVQDTTLLSNALREGMADFFAELTSGRTSNERLHVWAKGKEKQVWDEFKKEMWLNRSGNWIANAKQETADRPADLGYWVGYMICKAYYQNATDKKQAAWDILNIKDYKAFYEKSKVEEMIVKIK